MYARAAHTGKIEVETLGERSLQRVRHQFNAGLDGTHLFKRPVPVLVHVGRARVASLILQQLRQRHVDLRHDVPFVV
jgi:hypothetical protein